MMTRGWKVLRAGRTAAAAGVLLFLAQAGCNMTKVTVPGLIGPSELALSLHMTAMPDLLIADNRSIAVITVLVRDQNGQPAPGVPLVFAILEQGSVVSLGQLSRSTATTDGNGFAQTVYTAPARTDINNDLFIQIGARPLQGDATGAIYRTVGIELFPAEPSQFPQNPNAKVPLCNFAIEPAAGGSFHPGLQVLFQDASADPNVGGTIVRYQWDFGDGTQGDETPDVNHSYSFPGAFSVTHTVTDNFGQSSTCIKPINVF
jgi:hypothetical protein